MAKYEVKQTAISQILADVRSDKIAIPELQRLTLQRLSGWLSDNVAICWRQIKGWSCRSTSTNTNRWPTTSNSVEGRNCGTNGDW